MTIERMFRQWMQEFKCGCTDVQDKKKELLGYCGTHGDDARGKPFPVLVTASSRLETGQTR